MEGTLGLRGETHSPHPHHHVNPDPAPLPPCLTSASPGPSSAITLSCLWVLTPALTAPKGALQASWCTPETQGWVCTTRVLWALIMAQVKTIPSMEVGNDPMCQDWGRMLSTGTSSGGHLLPGQGTLPRPRVLQSQRQKDTHIYALIKLERGKKSKGLDQDPAMDTPYHGKD